MAFDHALSIVLRYGVLVAIIDRCVHALNESLNESDTRGLQLQRETVARERTQAQLLHAQKLETVGRVASGLAHDFDNFIGVILGFSTRRERLADSGAHALVDALEGVELAARRASAISRKLLDFSRYDVIAPKTFDVVQALRELKPMLRQLLGPMTRLRMRIEPDTCLAVRMDHGQFEMMVLNIAANARDAMPVKGIFDMTLRSDNAGHYALLVLSDNGSGMDEHVSAHIFEPFYTTKLPGNGTGLGLGVVRDLVEEVGGMITVQSTPGNGASFTIQLPLVDMPLV
ncbi:MAG: ATP-binding protein [Rhodanobacter sp.]